MDGLTAVMSAIVTQFALNTPLVSAVGTKIWQNEAPPNLISTFPYLLMSYGSGGIRNDAPYDAVDVEILITAISTNSTQAKAISALIETSLKNKVIPYPDGWVSNSSVRQTDFYTRTGNIQQAQYHQVGGYYRFRASKAKG